MNVQRIMAALICLIGVLVVTDGAICYAWAAQQASVPAMSLPFEESHRAIVPMWLGVGAILASALFLLYGADHARNA